MPRFRASDLRAHDLLVAAEDSACEIWAHNAQFEFEWAVTLAHGCVFVTRNKTTWHPSLRDALDAAMGSAK